MYIVEITWVSKSFGYCFCLVVCKLYISVSLHLGWAFELACSWDLLVKGVPIRVRAMSNTVIQSQVVIKNDLISKHPWYPEVQECEGKTFIKLERLSREFTRYCAGRSLDLRKSKAFSLNGNFLNQIVKERNVQSTEAYYEACSTDDATPSKSKKRRVSEGDSVVCPSTVLVKLPPSTDHPERLVKCLWGVNSMPLWVELEASILEHIRSGTLEAPQESRVTWKKRSRSGSL